MGSKSRFFHRLAQGLSFAHILFYPADDLVEPGSADNFAQMNIRYNDEVETFQTWRLFCDPQINGF
jgi:hypothetical protein